MPRSLGASSPIGTSNHCLLRCSCLAAIASTALQQGHSRLQGHQRLGRIRLKRLVTATRAQAHQSGGIPHGTDCASHVVQEDQRLGANGPGAWRRSKTDALARRSGTTADSPGHAFAGGKWGPLGAGAAAAAPMVKRPLEELVTALRKACRSSLPRVICQQTGPCGTSF